MHEHLIESQRGGSPVIAGTQITVEAILRALAAGQTVDHVLTAHPELSRESSCQSSPLLLRKSMVMQASLLWSR